MLKRPCFACGKPVRASMCDECLKSRPPQKRKPDNRPSRQARGYGREYAINRKIMIDTAWAHQQPCILCGRGFASKSEITAEHIIPLRSGGTNNRDNLGPSHQKCNSGWAAGTSRIVRHAEGIEP